MTNGRTVGIDLGTTRTAVAHLLDGESEIIENDEGDRVTPSVVHIESTGRRVVGKPAQAQLRMKPERTVKEIKREMGDTEKTTVGDEEYSPEQISAMILEKVKDDAENRLGEEITEAVITVPAYFRDDQRAATKSAAQIAGLDVDHVLDEPVAACLAYGVRQGKLGADGKEFVFVYDLGGGTFDATLVNIDYDRNNFVVKNTDGDSQLGGSDWTQAIVEWILDRIEKEEGTRITPESHPQQYMRIVDTAEDVKKNLSSRSSTDVILEFVLDSYNFTEELTREQFERMTSDLLQETQDPMDDLFERAEITKEQVDNVVLVGGATRMPQVRDLVEDYFGQEPSHETNPDEAVAKGAAVHADFLANVSDETEGSGSQDVESAALPGEGGITVNPVLPQSLGVRLNDGSVDTLIEQDTDIPETNRKDRYSTVTDTQTQVKIEVFQGESELAEDNHHIGTAPLPDIPERPSSKNSIAVEFHINEEGTLEVEGVDLESNKTVEMEFDSELRYTPEEIDEERDDLPDKK